MDINQSEFKLPRRKIGSQGLIASVQGLGSLGITAFYLNDEVTQEEKF